MNGKQFVPPLLLGSLLTLSQALGPLTLSAVHPPRGLLIVHPQSPCNPCRVDFSCSLFQVPLPKALPSSGPLGVHRLPSWRRRTTRSSLFLFGVDGGALFWKALTDEAVFSPAIESLSKGSTRLSLTLPRLGGSK